MFLTNELELMRDTLIHWCFRNNNWASAWDFQQCGMCDQQRLRSACAYMQSDQSLCSSLEYSMSVKLLTEHLLEVLSLKGGCTGSSESTLVKMLNCWKSHATAQLFYKTGEWQTCLNILLVCEHAPGVIFLYPDNSHLLFRRVGKCIAPSTAPMTWFARTLDGVHGTVNQVHPKWNPEAYISS